MTDQSTTSIGSVVQTMIQKLNYWVNLGAATDSLTDIDSSADPELFPELLEKITGRVIFVSEDPITLDVALWIRDERHYSDYTVHKLFLTRKNYTRWTPVAPRKLLDEIITFNMVKSIAHTPFTINVLKFKAFVNH